MKGTDKYRRDGTAYPDGQYGLFQWAKDQQNHQYKVVRQETLPNGYWVSTVWLGLNHNFGEGPPLIFETMVTNPAGDWEDYQERYSTEQEAMEGHKRTVRRFSRRKK
jgi:hypothetical protein